MTTLHLFQGKQMVAQHKYYLNDNVNKAEILQRIVHFQLNHFRLNKSREDIQTEYFE